MSFLYDNSPLIFPNAFSPNDIIKHIDAELQIPVWQWVMIMRQKISPDMIKMILNMAFDYYIPIQGETIAPVFWLHKWFDDPQLQKANPFIIIKFREFSEQSNIITASHDTAPDRITYPKKRNLKYLHIGEEYDLYGGWGNILMGVTIPDIDKWDIELQYGPNRFKIAGYFIALKKTYANLKDTDYKVVLEKSEPVKVWYFDLYPVVKYYGCEIKINCIAKNGSDSDTAIKKIYSLVNPEVHAMLLKLLGSRRFILGDWQWIGGGYKRVIKK